MLGMNKTNFENRTKSTEGFFKNASRISSYVSGLI